MASVDIQWERLAQPNQTGNLLAGYEAGKQAGVDRDTKNALGLYAQGDAEGAYKALLPIDPQKAMAVRKAGREDKAYSAREAAAPMISEGKYGEAAKSLAGIDPDFATQLMTWQKTATAEQKAAAEAAAEKVARALLPLKGLSPQEAAARWPAIKASLGPDTPDIDFSDPGVIDAHINQAMEVKDLIANDFKAQELDLKKSDIEADNRRGDAQLDVSRGQLGVARSNSARGWASHNERKKAGGFGTPGGSSGEWEEID